MFDILLPDSETFIYIFFTSWDMWGFILTFVSSIIFLLLFVMPLAQNRNVCVRLPNLPVNNLVCVQKLQTQHHTRRVEPRRERTLQHERVLHKDSAFRQILCPLECQFPRCTSIPSRYPGHASYRARVSEKTLAWMCIIRSPPGEYSMTKQT